MAGLTVTNLESVEATAHDKVFCDTNILIFLYGYGERQYTNAKKRVDKLRYGYERELQRLADGGTTLIINDLVLSEFCWRFEQSTRDRLHSKARRESSSDRESKKKLTPKQKRELYGRESCPALIAAMEKINSRFKVKPSMNLSIPERSRLLDKYCTKLDLNDMLFADFCNKMKCPMITDDSDFLSYQENLSVFTLSKRILSAANTD